MEKRFRVRGEVYLLLSGFFFGLQPFLAKIIYAHGGNAYGLYHDEAGSCRKDLPRRSVDMPHRLLFVRRKNAA